MGKKGHQETNKVEWLGPGVGLLGMSSERHCWSDRNGGWSRKSWMINQESLARRKGQMFSFIPVMLMAWATYDLIITK